MSIKKIAIQMDDIKKIDFEFDSSFIIGLEGQKRNYKLFYYHPNDLFIDEGLYGGGLNIYPVGSHLTTHIDFNYNNDLQAYRSVNLLYYMIFLMMFFELAFFFYLVLLYFLFYLNHE